MSVGPVAVAARMISWGLDGARALTEPLTRRNNVQHNCRKNALALLLLSLLALSLIGCSRTEASRNQSNPLPDPHGTPWRSENCRLHFERKFKPRANNGNPPLTERLIQTLCSRDLITVQTNQP